jgi:hypothetical protein
VVGAGVGAIDHRVGFADQFVMQSGSDEAPDNGRRRRVGVNHVVGDIPILNASGEGPVHVLMMSPRMPRSRNTASASRSIIH